VTSFPNERSISAATVITEENFEYMSRELGFSNVQKLGNIELTDGRIHTKS
jgi:dsRNA-specific ribonuclease